MKIKEQTSRRLLKALLEVVDEEAGEKSLESEKRIVSGVEKP